MRRTDSKQLHSISVKTSDILVLKLLLASGIVKEQYNIQIAKRKT